MSNYYIPPPPTWRLCHPVNIYVYQNGVSDVKPYLVHIPMEKKKNMTTVLEAIGARMKLPVGYPVGLYHMDGQRVCKTYELEMYNNYVVVTNLEKRFKCVCYGRVREPLVVIGPYSKHVNTLRAQNKKFDLFCRRNMARKPLHELMANTGEQDGLGPSELTTGNGKPCGALCHKVLPRRDRLTQCCSDEIMCVEGAAMDLEKDECRLLQKDMERRCFDEQRRSLEVPPGTQLTDEDCQLVQELQNKVREVGTERTGGGMDGSSGPLGVNKNLMDLMLRYKDVGSDIFKLFQNKINRDLDDSVRDSVSAKWQIPGGSSLSLETQQRVKEELMRLAEQSCQFTFDKHGNFLFSDGCRVSGAGGVVEERFSDLAVMTGEERQYCTSKIASCSGSDGQQRRPSQQGGGNASNPQVTGNGGGSQLINMLQMEVDEENNVSRSSIPGLKTSDFKKTTTEEATGTSEIVMENGDGDEEMQDRVQNDRELEKQSSKQRVNKMQSEITEIVGNMRRSLTISRSNSNNEGLLPPAMDMPSPSRTLSIVREEEEEEGGGVHGAGVKAVVSPGSRKGSKKDDNDEGGDVDVFSLMMESRNPFREGLMVPPLAGKLHKDRLDKLFAENPFRRPWFHGEETPSDLEEKDEDPVLQHILPPEDSINMSPIFSPRWSRTEWWPPKQPDVFLQQINELVHRHDNTKATSPPPSPTLKSNDSTRTFTIGPSPTASGARMVSVSCGQSKSEVNRSNSKTNKPSPRCRNVCAQVDLPRTKSGIEIEEWKGEEKVRSPRWRPIKCYEGGTQTRKAEDMLETLQVLPSEDEKPAGIYEGYQESIKSDLLGEIFYSENDGDDERNVYYRKRRENRKVRRKRKEHCLYPCGNFSPEEEEFADEEEEIEEPGHAPNPFQEIRFIINGSGGTNYGQPTTSGFPEIPPSQQQQQPIFVQTSSTASNALPFVARHSTQTSSPTVMKAVQQGGGLITTASPQSQIRLPLLLSQQNGNVINSGGFSVNNNNNQDAPSVSPLFRQPIIFSTQSTASQLQQPNNVKYLPVLQPQNTSVRLIRLVNPTQQQFVNSSPSVAFPVVGGALQNKLIQMMAPVNFPPQQMQIIQQPQQQSQPLPQPPSQPQQQQFVYK